MDSKPMFTLLTTELQDCRKPGTSVRESGIKVSTQTLIGETIIFFHTDCNEGRRGLKVESENNKICDYLILYTQDENESEIICFLELKGTKLETAMQQVQRTHKYLKDLADEKISRQYRLRLNVFWRICICLRSSASNANQRVRDQLIQKFGGDNVVIRHGTTYHDIGPLLRKKPN